MACFVVDTPEWGEHHVVDAVPATPAYGGSMDEDELKSILLVYLQRSRTRVVEALDGLTEHQIRRPMTPSGTNLLGLVKHLASTEHEYFVTCLDQASTVTIPWILDGSIDDGADMWATAAQSREYLTGLYRSVWAETDATVRRLPLATPALVPWWEASRQHTTMAHVVVHVVSETAQHAGHCDIVRESIDGRGGPYQSDLGDAEFWAGYVAKIEDEADTFGH